MRIVHLISVNEPLMYDTAIAICEKGYEVSVSGMGLTDEVISRLQEAGCTCYGDGWFPDKLTKDLQTVVLGAAIEKDNPELIRARELGLRTQSVSEFIFERTKSKTRVVVAGSLGKSSVLSMIVYALQKQKLAFDYFFSGRTGLLPVTAKMSYEARIALIEGDDHITSALEKKVQLEFYRPHIAVLTSLCWSEGKDQNSPEEYLDTYTNFVASIKREGKLIYFEGSEAVRKLAEEVREDITPIPYDCHVSEEKEGENWLKTRYGDFHVYIPDEYFLINLNAARLACRQLGVKDADFYQAVSEYSLSLRA